MSASQPPLEVLVLVEEKTGRAFVYHTDRRFVLGADIGVEKSGRFVLASVDHTEAQEFLRNDDGQLVPYDAAMNRWGAAEIARAERVTCLVVPCG